MNGLLRFGAFWYHFVVGDDWRIAAGVILGLGITALVAHSGHIQAWWLLPGIVVIMLTISLWGITRRR